MGRRDLYVFNAAAAIPLLVLEANVRELDVPIDARQMPLARPTFDLLRRPVGATGRVAPSTVRGLQEALIVAFQFLFEDDAMHPRAPPGEPVGGLFVRSIQPRIMCQLARLRDAGVELLAGLVTSGSAALLEDFAATIRERDKGRPGTADDVRHGADQSLAPKVREVTIPHAGIAVLLAQIRRRHDPKRSRGGECSHF
jgi:hypothetical protein